MACCISSTLGISVVVDKRAQESEGDRSHIFVPSLGRDITLSEFDTGYTCNFKDKRDAEEKLAADLKQLAVLQEMFFADRQYALLIIFQGLDAAGKDGAIRHVMSGISPQGVDVVPFKQPSEEELSHDYLWRSARALPERGRFDGSPFQPLVLDG